MYPHRLKSEFKQSSIQRQSNAIISSSLAATMAADNENEFVVLATCADCSNFSQLQQ